MQYIVLVMLCLAFFLISNLHFLTVYRSAFIQTHMSKLMVFSFILPLSLVIPVALQKKIENPGFGSICFVSSDAASAYFFYPLSVVVCLATLLHLGTIAFMIRTSLQANKNNSVTNHSLSTVSDSNGQQPPRKRLQTARDISLLLKQQWRPGLLALCLLIIDMIYWLFYFIEAKKLMDVTPTTPWFVNWSACLGQQAMLSLQSGILTLNPTPAQFKAAGDAAQAACAHVAVNNVPDFTWAAASDMLPALFGIMILIIFGSRMELWQDLRTKFFGPRGGVGGGRSGSGGHTPKGNAKIMMTDVQHDNQYSQKVPERPRPDFTPYRQEAGFYDEDLQPNENPYGSQTNLAVPSGTTTFGGADAKMNDFNSSSRQGGYRLDTPEPWKPPVWSSDAATMGQQEDMYNTTFRSASPQLRINTNNDHRQYQQATNIARAMSPISPSQPKRFYNSEDIDAAPISLTTPPTTYNNGHSRKTGPSTKSPSSPLSSRAFAHGHGPVSPQRNAAMPVGDGQAIVAEASRVRLDYRISADARQFMASPQPNRQPAFDQMEPSSHRAMSPPPALPRKSMARQK